MPTPPKPRRRPLASRPSPAMTATHERLWMLEPSALSDLVTRRRLPEAASAAGNPGLLARMMDRPEAQQYQTVNGVAVIDVAGVLLKSWSIDHYFSGGLPMPILEEQVRRAARDPDAKAILLRIDSPGGTVAGTSDLADAIYEARSAKPVAAYVSDKGCSAAYYVACQAHRVYSDLDAEVGNIGVYAVMVDLSEMAAKEGARVHVVRYGALKGAGEPGTPITAEHLAEEQRIIDALGETFVAAIVRGRGVSVETARSWADGRCHVGAAAVTMGLTDGLISQADLLTALSAGKFPAVSSTSTPSRAVSGGPSARTCSRRPPWKKESAMNPKLRKYLESLGLDAGATEAQAVTSWHALTGDDREIADALATAPAPAPVAATPAPATGWQAEGRVVTPPSEAETRRQAALGERDRIAQIRGMAETLGLDPVWSQEMVNGGFAVADARAKALEKMAATRTPAALGAGAVTVGRDLAQDGRDSMTAGMADAIALRAGSPLFEEEDARSHRLVLGDDGKPKRRAAHERAREFRGMRLSEMARACLAAAGVPHAGGLSNSEVARLSLNRRLLADRYGGALAVQSTSDFANILGSVVHRTLRAAYAEKQTTWQFWARRGVVPDFRNVERASLSAFPGLQARLEGQGIRFAAFGDQKEVYALAEYAGGVLISSRVIINDDLDFVQRMPQACIAAGYRKEDDVAYAILSANAALADGKALFDTTYHGNVGTTAALSVTSLGEAKALMAKQKAYSLEAAAANKAYLNLQPVALLVAPEREVVAVQLIGSSIDPDKNNANNPFFNRLQVVSEPRIATPKWYLACDPNQCDTVEVGFLEGAEGPEISEETDFDTDSLKMKVLHRVAAKAIDYRGLIYNAGA